MHLYTALFFALASIDISAYAAPMASQDGDPVANTTISDHALTTDGNEGTRELTCRTSIDSDE